ncbi:MAG TPA: alpha/beta fold hydrolase [Candidatus Sulfopaludibacter sp.]|jgi:hypothetical protein|nr:alpha/beta fold hydrolase [Candidatus Sulfopaludibacter sp.]
MKIVLAAMLIVGSVAAADGLKRHGAIGLTVAADEQHRVVVRSAAEGGAGAAAGIQADDWIQKMDGAAVTSAEFFARSVGGHLAGDTVKLEIARDGETSVKSAVLKARPLETSPWGEVMYESVTVRGALRRVIVTRPKKAGRLPAVMLMQGLGCYSVDNQDRKSGYGRVLDELEQRGYVTMRVEKTGEGDSEGPACGDMRATASLEAEGYLAGLRALKKYDFVDPDKVFVFAHSMGPVVGSLAIAQEPVRGFIAVETVGTSWFEYDLERLRVQAALGGKTPEEVDARLREYTPCSYRYYIAKETPQQLDQTPACRDFAAPFGGASYTYMQSVADISLGKQWKTADFPVLVVYGTGSPVTTAHQGRYLTELINRMHPARATYAEVPGMGHDLNLYESPKEYMERGNSPHAFATGLIDLITAWMAKVG